MFCVVFTPDALRDIVNMQRYFSAAGTSATANGYVDGVIQACLDLAHFPNAEGGAMPSTPISASCIIRSDASSPTP